jgi:DNA-binding LacI/PurR family transcriptional regulator
LGSFQSLQCRKIFSTTSGWRSRAINSGGGLAGLNAVRELARESALVRRSILGFIMWDITLPRHAVATVLRILSDTRRPVCLLNETGRSLAPASVAQSDRFRRFRMASEPRDGRGVGDFLLRKGHTRIVYIDTSPGSAVSRGRYEGLCEAFAAAGHVEGIEMVSVPQDGPVGDPDGDLGKVFKLGGRVARRMMTRRKDRALTRVRLEFEVMLALDGAAVRRRTRERLFSRLERCLDGGSATAWVAYSDSDAADCLDFLECAGRRVPEDIAVVGFDDSLTAVYHQLTSYNFGGDAYMHAMIRHIIDPAATAALAQPVRFDGYVVERGTT